MNERMSWHQLYDDEEMIEDLADIRAIAYFVVICDFLNSAISSSVALEHIVVPEEEKRWGYFEKKQPYRSRS